VYRVATLLLTGGLAAAADLGEQAVGILRKNCFVCHGGGITASKLDLRTRESAIAGGERGAALMPSNVERSLLFKLASHEANPTMPPGAKLPDSDLDVLRRWIVAGAPWPEQGAREADAGKLAALKKMEERPVTEEERRFWSFRRPVRPAVPANGESHPVDAFLREQWRARGLKPSPEADRRTLVRRVFLDLTGLPPTPEQVREFVEDPSPDAWPNLVERLLASPHYGERWARHWLDLVRYADSGGYEYDNDRPEAWRYRDWVVNAFNSGKSYRDFIREQIAGDEIDPRSPGHQIATGFLRLGPEQNIKTEMTRADELDDIVSTTSLVFQGLTVGCARCHNHKFDPIPQKDYYQIQAVFFSTKNADFPLVPADEVARYKAEIKRLDGLLDPHKTRKAELEKPHREILFEQRIERLAPYMREAWRTPPEKRTEGQRLNARQIERTLQIKEEEIVAHMSEAERAEHAREVKAIADIEKLRPKPYASAMAIGEHGREPLPSYFLHRGSPSNKGSRMEPGVFTVANWKPFELRTPPPDAVTSYRRLSFAEWIASPDNPLTARVMVNRIWQRRFGEGIVATPNNFGRKGEPPSNPKLLDWLAVEFMENGWSVKAMDRLILNSKAYRMASDDIGANLAIDRGNRFVWRQGRTRLDAETIRDSMLAVAGTLNPALGGPAVHPYIDPALFQGSSKRTWPGKPDDDPSTWRRSLYVFNKRSIRYPMFESFDQPDMITSCSRRNSSITAPQALLLMNNSGLRLQARLFARRLEKEAGADVKSQVNLAFELAFARRPSAAESARSVDFIQSSSHGLVDFCQALFNSNEFVFMP